MRSLLRMLLLLLVLMLLLLILLLMLLLLLLILLLLLMTLQLCKFFLTNCLLFLNKFLFFNSQSRLCSSVFVLLIDRWRYFAISQMAFFNTDVSLPFVFSLCGGLPEAPLLKITNWSLDNILLFTPHWS